MDLLNSGFGLLVAAIFAVAIVTHADRVVVVSAYRLCKDSLASRMVSSAVSARPGRPASRKANTTCHCDCV